MVAMAPHLTKLELDFIFEEEGKGVPMKEIHRMLQRRRANQGHDAPCLRRFSEAFRGRTYRRSKQEIRGRTHTFTREWVQKLDRTRRTCNEQQRESAMYAGRMFVEPLVHLRHTAAH